MIIINLIKPNEHLPSSSYQLAMSAQLIDEAKERWKKDKICRTIRKYWIEEIEKIFEYSVDLFLQDKDGYTKKQKHSFLIRKMRAEQALMQLKQLDEKMCICETKKDIYMTIV